jgi:pyruvate/2-oxoglutarate dehydrogenase complex dihydrolipoamide dehydrogenase (E3) component
MGAETVLIERAEMGGDCLNVGCVPSKSLIAAARLAADVRRGPAFGVDAGEPAIDFARVNRHVHEVIAAIAPHDSQERFEGLGVTVLRGAARFADARSVAVGDTLIRARRFVIATGSRPAVPAIPGLDTVPYLTNETIWANKGRPDHLIVIGAGPIGLELAQAHRRLGSQVTVLEKAQAMPKDDPELAAIVVDRLRAEGVTIREGVSIASVSGADGAIAVDLGPEGTLRGSHVLVAAGRQPTLDGLDLDAAGIEAGGQGIKTDRRLRTSNKRVFAAGDVTGGMQFTHMAGFHASVVVRNVLFRLPAKAEPSAFPWVTFTDPELAQVGLTVEQARAEHGDGVRVLTQPFSGIDRAQAERQTEGTLKAVVSKRGRILGCGIAGPQAGELILPWVLAMGAGLKIGKLATMIVPYPTLGDVSRQAASSFYKDQLFSARTRWLVRLLSRFG